MMCIYIHTRARAHTESLPNRGTANVLLAHFWLILIRNCRESFCQSFFNISGSVLEVITNSLALFISISVLNILTFNLRFHRNATMLRSKAFFFLLLAEPPLFSHQQGESPRIKRRKLNIYLHLVARLRNNITINCISALCCECN
jgi:hypothetical protein